MFKNISMKAKVALASASTVIASAVMALAAHAQSVPTVGTTDMAAVGAPILTSLVTMTEYVLQTFGPPLFWISAVIALFFAIYHRAKTGRWL